MLPVISEIKIYIINFCWFARFRFSSAFVSNRPDADAVMRSEGCHYSVARLTACVTQLNAPLTWHRVKSATQLKSVIKPSSLTRRSAASSMSASAAVLPASIVRGATFIVIICLRPPAPLRSADWHALRLRQPLTPLLLSPASAAEVTCRMRRLPWRRDVASDNRLGVRAWCAGLPRNYAGPQLRGGGWVKSGGEGG